MADNANVRSSDPANGAEVVFTIDTLTIAAVTATLLELLLPAARAAVGGAEAYVSRPGASNQGEQPKKGIHIYLYQVVPNAAWRNTIVEARTLADPAKEGPDKRSAGDTVKRRSRLVPLNLHYLLSFYGDEPAYEPQRLLNAAVGVLESRPQLDPKAIESMQKNTASLRPQGLADLDAYLQRQAQFLQNVRLTPIGLNLEELSKLWSVFFQVPYTLSVAYEAAVALIDLEPVAPLKLVKERGLYVDQAERGEAADGRGPAQEAGGRKSSQQPPGRPGAQRPGYQIARQRRFGSGPMSIRTTPEWRAANQASLQAELAVLADLLAQHAGLDRVSAFEVDLTEAAPGEHSDAALSGTSRSGAAMVEDETAHRPGDRSFALDHLCAMFGLSRIRARPRAALRWRRVGRRHRAAVRGRARRSGLRVRHAGLGPRDLA